MSSPLLVARRHNRTGSAREERGSEVPDDHRVHRSQAASALSIPEQSGERTHTLRLQILMCQSEVQ